MVSGAKKQNIFNKQYEEGTFTIKQFRSLPNDKKQDYLTKELKKKYKLTAINFTCYECAITALFEEDGYITDDDLINATGLRRK